MEKQAKLYIISAPSGAGKSTLVEAILNKIGSHCSLSRAITYTTRQPRINERDGYDFHFLTEETFKQLIEQGFFLEWSNAHTAYYGTPRSILNDLNRGQSFLLVIDRVGAEKIRAQTEHAVLVWITVPSMAILKERLVKRGTEDQATIERRLKRAQEEIALEEQTPIYDYHIMNDDFNQAATELEAIIMAEIEGSGQVAAPNRTIVRQAV